ncbi:MAG: DUF1013 domain-containing protein [Candidatus Jidaibacter sp.]|nr:DUF1013 domain-containing protein [Candidatus Jidaibacter sp.]
MSAPLMPKATAVWLIENTTLTFEQIADFCGIHYLEVQGIADGDVAKGISGVDPIVAGQLTREELERCEKDPSAKLKLSESAAKFNYAQSKNSTKGKYTPVARRQDKPDAVAWILKNCPEISDAQIVKLIGTTKNTIESVRSKTHWNSQNIKPKDPVLLGLCSQSELDKIHSQARKKAELNESRKKQQITIDLDSKLTK